MKVLISNYYINNEEYKLIELINSSNMIIMLSSCGAGIRNIMVPDKNGYQTTVTLAPLDNEKYNLNYHGKIIGRTSGRIENASFKVGKNIANLDKNNFGIDNLHGGFFGINMKNFSYEIIENIEYTEVNFNCFTKDGEGGYFGDVFLTVSYHIYENINKFIINISGKSNVKNLLNITNHVYWNLSGDFKENVLDHELYINSSYRGVLDTRLIEKKVIPVTDEFDFRNSRPVGTYINSFLVTENTKGYDHPFYLDNEKVAAELKSNNSGISLKIKTSYPVVVCYSNNFPLENVEIFDGIYDDLYMGICLECQYSPNAIHLHPESAGIFEIEDGYNEYIAYEFNTN